MIGIGRWLLLAFGHSYYQHGYTSLIVLTIAAGPISASYWLQTILRLAGKLRAIIVVNAIGAIATCSAVWFASSHGLITVAWAWLGGCAVTALAVGLAAPEKSREPIKAISSNTFKHSNKPQEAGVFLVERRFMTRLFAVSASRRRKILKLILPMRTYKACRLALRRVVLRWIEGDSASLRRGHRC